MPPGQYRKPPITEAVIELRFGDSVSADTLAKYVREMKSRYPNAEEAYEITAMLEVAKEGKEPLAKTTQKFMAHKLTGRDSTDLVLVHLDRLGTIRLAPYCGWDVFIERAKDNYAALKKITGYRTIVRVSTRYINRIDIPRAARQSIEVNEYVLTEPSVPSAIPVLHSFTTQFTGAVPAIDGHVIVNTGTIESPLIDHFSIMLDIDLFREQKLPQKDSEIWDLLGHFHTQKNSLFEAFVTDKARELFDHA